MIKYIQNLILKIKGITRYGAIRSSKWQNIREKHLTIFNKCSVCGSFKSLEVHHIKPFAKFPELELDVSNLITLCEYHDCHLIFGHLGNYKSYNENVAEDAKNFNNKIKNRP